MSNSETVYKSDRSNEVVSVTCSKDRMFTAVNVNTKLTSHVILLDNETLDSRGGGGGEENVVCNRKQSRLLGCREGGGKTDEGRERWKLENVVCSGNTLDYVFSRLTC